VHTDDRLRVCFLGELNLLHAVKTFDKMGLHSMSIARLGENFK
jgi:hypothetical protein